MKSYIFHFLEKDYTLGFFYDRYTNNGNLYVGLINLRNEDDPYFADLTINTVPLPPYYAAIDNLLGRGIIPWLESIGAGKACKRNLRSNFALYPLFEFNPQFLQEANPERFAKLSQ